MVGFEIHTNPMEIIKPSSPTPDHLRSFELSALDQLVDGKDYSPIWYFYPSSKHDPCKSKSVEEHLITLKYSLSKALTHFYPLAGRVNGDSTAINCNDEGALFREAKLSCDMDDFLGLVSSKFEILHNLLPCHLTCSSKDEEKAAQVVVQANVFACGGIALGTCLSCRIMDGTTCGAFIRAWSEIARTNNNNFRGQEMVYGSITASSLFPPNESLPTLLADSQVVWPPGGDEVKKNCSIRRFLFDASAISSLKYKARSESVPNPTRVEVICALFWKCLAGDTTISTPSVLINFVNIRARLDPPLPTFSLGNICWLAIAIDDEKNNQMKELPYFIDLLRNSIKRIDSKYLKDFQGQGGLERIRKFREDAKEFYAKPGLTIAVSAINRVGFYDADFGRGEPLWMTSAPSYHNDMFLIETKSGDGIEATVMLDDHQVKRLENDPEFRAHTRASSMLRGNL